MSNPFGKSEVQQFGVNPFGRYPNAPVVDESEQDIIAQSNNPNVPTPPSFGFVDIPTTGFLDTFQKHLADSAVKGNTGIIGTESALFSAGMEYLGLDNSAKDLAKGTAGTLARLPEIPAGMMVQAGELSQGMKGKSTIDVAKNSFMLRLAQNYAEGDKGLLGTLQSLWGVKKDVALSVVSDTSAPKMLINAGNSLYEANKEAIDFLGLKPTGTMSYDVGTGLGQMLITVGSTIIAKNPAIATAYMGLLTNEQAYKEARKAGKDPEQAAAIAAATTYPTMLIENLGGGVLLKAFGGSFMKRVLIRATGQGAEESAQGAVEETVMGVSGVRDTPIKEKLQSIAYQGLLGFILGVPVTGIFTKLEDVAKASGFDENKAKEIAGNIIKNKDFIVSAAVDIINKEASGVIDNTKATSDSITAMKNIIAEKEIADVKAQTRQDAVSELNTTLDFIDSNPDVQLPDVILTKLEALDIENLDNVSTEDIKSLNEFIGKEVINNPALSAMRDIKKATQKVVDESLAPIKAEQERERQKRIADIQAETDNIVMTAQRDVSELLDIKEEVDADTYSLLESQAELIKSRRATPKPVRLVDFLRSLGGVADRKGELETIGITKRERSLRNDKSGLTYDEARELAVESGYLLEGSNESDFLEALEADYKGYTEIVRMKDAGNQQQLDEIDNALSRINQALDEKGIGTEWREKLAELRRRIALNKRLDKAATREARAAQIKEIASRKIEEKVEKTIPTILADKLQTFINGIRKGQQIQKSETKAVQEELISMLENSELDAKEKSKFITTIKNIQTPEQLKAIEAMQKRIAELVDKQQRREAITSIKNTLSRVRRSKSVAVDIINKIKDMVNEIDLQKRNKDTISSLINTLNYMANNPDADMPKSVLNKLEILNKKPVEEVTTQDLMALDKEIRRLEEMGKVKLDLIKKRNERIKQKRIAELQKDSVKLSDKAQRRADIGERLSRLEKIKNKYIEARNYARRVKISINPMDVIFDMLDGNKSYKGANHRIFKQTIDAAYTRYLNLKDSIVDDVKELHRKLDLVEENYQKIGVWAALQQEGGREKLLNTGITEAELSKIESAGDKWLTPEETKMYNLMREKLDSMLPALKEVMRLVYNKDVVGVKDYFPFLTDYDAMEDYEVADMVGDNVPLLNRKNVEKGFTKERTGGKQAIRIDAMGVFMRHVSNAAYLIEAGGDIKQLGELASSKEYGDAVGGIGQDIVTEWMSLLARNGASYDANALADTLRRNVGAAVLGFKLSSILIQPTALLDAASLIGGNYIKDGIVAVGTSSEWRKFLLKNMPELRDRVGDDAAFLDMGGNGIVGTVREAGFYALKKIDGLVAAAAVAGAYKKSVESRGGVVDFNNPDPIAIQDAQLMMRRTQSSSFAKDSAPIITQKILTNSPSFNRLVTQFQSFMLNRWSIISHDFYSIGVRSGKTKQALNIATFMILAGAAEIGIRELSDEIINSITGFDDDKNKNKKTLADEVMRTVLGTVPFVSQAANIFQYGSNPVPALGIMNKIFEEIKLSGQSKNKDKQLQHTISALLLAAGVIGGVPGTLQAQQLLKKSSQE